MKEETIIKPEDQGLLNAINNVGDYWHQIALQDHPVLTQFDRKLAVTGFNAVKVSKTEERFYIYIAQLLILKSTGELYKEIPMATWEIYETDNLEIENAKGKLIQKTVIKDEQGKIIEEKESYLQVQTIKYIKFLLIHKQAHLLDLFEKFMSLYKVRFADNINNI